MKFGLHLILFLNYQNQSAAGNVIQPIKNLWPNYVTLADPDGGVNGAPGLDLNQGPHFSTMTKFHDFSRGLI